MRLGLADERKLTDEVLAAVREPFQTTSRAARWRTRASACEPEGFVEIARLLPSLRDAGAGDLRRAGPDPARHRRDDGAREAGPAAGRGHGAARLRALPPGGGAGARSARCSRGSSPPADAAQAASPARSAAATSSIAARAARPTPTALRSRGRARRGAADGDRHAGFLAAAGVLLALVAQHVEPGHRDMCGREAGEVVGQQRGRARVERGIRCGQVVVAIPVHLPLR